jgi:glycosyltransferase involved in cell wall biosynthesis
MSKERISIYTPAFFDAYGNDSIIGGLERYLRSLVDLLQNNNYEVDVHQTAILDFEKEYNGAKCYGWKIQGDHFKMLDFIHSKTADKVIYAYLGQQCEYKQKSVVISHGIFWNYVGGDVNYVKALLEPALKQTKLVSVDLDTINFIRATFTNMNHNAKNNMFYVPNFADNEKFHPVVKNDGYITILYPRRNDEARGITPFKNIATRLLAKYNNVKIKFAVDTNNSATHQSLLDWIEQNPNKDRIDWKKYSYDEMPLAYQSSDISVIPTMWSEGTSYSAIEAMACGNAIVSTNVGGLSNLIIDNHNGLLTNPNEEELYNAIEKLVLSEQLRNELSLNAISTARAFSKDAWDRRWLDIVERM